MPEIRLLRESVLVCNGTVKIELKVNDPGSKLLNHDGAVSFFASIILNWGALFYSCGNSSCQMERG